MRDVKTGYGSMKIIFSHGKKYFLRDIGGSMAKTITFVFAVKSMWSKDLGNL